MPSVQDAEQRSPLQKAGSMSEPQPENHEVKKTRVRKKSLDIQLQQALDDAAEAIQADPSTQKCIQERLRVLMALRDEQKTANKTEALEAENERLKQQLAKTQVLEVLPVAPSVDPSDLAVQGMLARIKSVVTPEPEPELTPEEIARAEEMKQELAAKEQEIIQARRDKAEREHREAIAKRNAELDEMHARVDALIVQQTETNERELAKLGQVAGYVPSTTDTLKGYERPQTWAKW